MRHFLAANTLVYEVVSPTGKVGTYDVMITIEEAST